jgi:hypothetical protein
MTRHVANQAIQLAGAVQGHVIQPIIEGIFDALHAAGVDDTA